MKIKTDKEVHLRRSHAPYSCGPLAVTYLIVAVVISSVVVVVNFLPEPAVEIINGLPYATDVPGLDRNETTGVSQWEKRFRRGFIGWVRLVPVPDHPEPVAAPPSEVYSVGREDQDGSVLPTSYSPVFSESDLMRRLPGIERVCYTSFYYRYTSIPYER